MSASNTVFLRLKPQRQAGAKSKVRVLQCGVSIWPPDSSAISRPDRVEQGRGVDDAVHSRDLELRKARVDLYIS